MTWLAWRRQRAGLLVLAAVALLLGLAMVYLRFDMQAAAPAARSTFVDQYEPALTMLLYAMLLMPLLAGMFLGAPLFAREFEQQTHLLVLTQSVGRVRWVPTMLGVAAAASAVVMVVLAALFGWTHEASGGLLQDAAGEFGRAGFEAGGLLPAVYAVFAVAAGAALGLLLRNAVAAVGATLAVFGVVRYGLERIRPEFMPPQVVREALTASDGIALARPPEGSMELRLQAGYVDRAGEMVTRAAADAQLRCEGIVSAACARDHGYVAVYGTYHGPERYWLFQLIEAGVLLALAAVLLGAGLYWLRSHTR
jgi:hypothetical protein